MDKQQGKNFNSDKIWKIVERFLIALSFSSKIGCLIAYLVTGEVLWLVFIPFVLIFTAPIYYSLLEEFLGEERIAAFENIVWTTLLILTAFSLVLCTAGIILYQLYLFLKNGTWFGISVINLMQLLDIKWAIEPADWIGLWMLLDKVPLSLILLFLAACTYTTYEKQVSKVETR